MKKIKLIIFSLIALLTVTSCEDILSDNINPDKGHAITAEAALPVVIFYSQQIVYDHAEYYVYLSQALTTGGKASVGSYSYKSEWEFLTMNRHPMWRRHFYDVGVNVKNLIQLSKDINSPNYELIARTIRLMSTQLTTDCFGDIPRSQAYLSNAPKYDTQASVYDWMLKEADELIKMFENDALVNCPTNQKISFAQDRVYGGDLNKWKGLVYAIKARILLRNIPNIDRSSTMCDKIIAASDAAIKQWRQGDLQHGAWFGNEPRYKFDGGTSTQNCVWSAANPIINSWESRANLLQNSIVSKYFLVDCLGILNADNDMKCGRYVTGPGYANDPRAALLFIAREGPASVSNTDTKLCKLRFLENNIGMGTSFKVDNYPNLYFNAYTAAGDAYNAIFTMEELYFIKAEAEYWKGNKGEACRLAKEATENNINRHLQNFIERYPNPNYSESSDNKYPGNATTAGPGYTTAKFWEAQMDAFLNDNTSHLSSVKSVTTRGNKHFFFNESEYSLYDLMTQKWISMYLQPEQWTDMRRYHYSNKRNNYGVGDSKEIVYKNLRRPYNLYTSYWIDGLTEAEKENCWIQRINYDNETEEKYNRAELERLGAYKNYKWLQKPMIWAQDYGVRTSLTAE